MKRLMLHYDFTEVNSTIVGDVSGQGMAGVVRGYDAGGMQFAAEDIYGCRQEIISLPGGANGGYIELPAGILQKNEGITISFWCRMHEAVRGDMLLALGCDQALYVRILSAAEAAEAYETTIEGEGFVLVPCITSGGTSQEWQALNTVVLQKHRWYMITITLDKEPESHLKYYVDARLAADLKNRRMAAGMLYEVDQSFFGRGLADTTPVKVDFADIRIYHTVMGADEIDAMFQIEDEVRVVMDAQQIKIPEIVVEDFALPSVGTYGSVIQWKSCDSSVITDGGQVKRPAAGNGDAVVEMTAAIHHGAACKVYTYEVTVKALPTEQEIAEHDAAVLAVPGYHHVYQDLKLPASGEWGSSITYESSEPSVVDSSGKVHRPIGKRVPVMLRAHLVCGKASVDKELALVVMPESAGADMDRFSLGKRTGDIVDKTVVRNEEPRRMRGHRAALDSAEMTGRNILIENRDRDLVYLHLLDADRMLYNFRAAFGQDTRGAKPLGGWDEPMGLLRGHSTGHFLSALAYAYVQTGDSRLRDKLEYMVAQLRQLQKMSKGRPSEFHTACSPNNASQRLWSKDPSRWGEGFLSAYSPDQFALLEQYTPYATIWAPYYTLHKILAGLLDAYLYTSNETALEAACGIGDWVSDRLSVLSREQLAKMWSMYIAGEYGGMNESLSTLYLITGADRYRKTAALFDNMGFWAGLAEGKDTIAGRHANQHIPQIIGALQEYRATGEVRYYQIARNFWKIVTAQYTYAIGGVGRGEMFKEAGVLAGNIEGTTNCETCAAYNMLKLTQELYRYEPDCAEYMDYYERTQLNQIAASQTPHVTEFRHNGVTYMLPIGPGARRRYSTDYDDFSCCHGTGMENHVKYQENIYYQTEEAVYVNLYIPSELTLNGGRLVMSGTLPGENMKLSAMDMDVKVRLRIPYWCRDSLTVKHNAVLLTAMEDTEPVKTQVEIPEDADYVEVLLKAGESVDILLPYRVHLNYTPDRLEGSQVAAVMYGPLVMVALSEETAWQEILLGTDIEEDYTVEWVDGQPQLDYYGLKFIPMYAAHEVAYHTYVKVKVV